ncbi:MAG: hypothetical protein O2963_00030 [Proteobacteria bacterium]|nr:hypothetical protein [Pseudomonadota bacterium]
MRIFSKKLRCKKEDASRTLVWTLKDGGFEKVRKHRPLNNVIVSLINIVSLKNVGSEAIK